MLSLTRKSDYAIVAMAELARSTGGRASARTLSELTSVPLPVLTNILHMLVGAGLVQSSRGAQGGYRLSVPPEQISLFSIMAAVEGACQLTLCCAEPGSAAGGSVKHQCDLEDDCRIKAPIRRVQERLKTFLDGVDLAYIAFDQMHVPLGFPGGVMRTDTGDHERQELAAEIKVV